MKSWKKSFRGKISPFGLITSKSTTMLVLLGFILLLDAVSLSPMMQGIDMDEIATNNVLPSRQGQKWVGSMSFALFSQNSHQSPRTSTVGVENDQWSKTYDLSGYDEAHSVIQTTDGGFVFSGISHNGTEIWSAWLVKIDTDGEELWRHVYGSEWDLTRLGTVIQTTDGGFALTGFFIPILWSEADAWLIKTDAQGEVEWTQSYGTTVSWDAASAVIQTMDGGFVLVGTTLSIGSGLHDVWLVKTDARGVMEWERAYGTTAAWEEGCSVIQTGDQGFVLIGSIGGASTAWIIKTDEDGLEQWELSFDSAKAAALIETTDGGFVIAGTTWPPGEGGRDAWLTKITAQGEPEWMQSYGGHMNYTEAHSVIQTADGGFILVGSRWYYNAGPYDVLLVKTDATGKMEWTKTYSYYHDDIAYSIIPTMDGDFIIAGTTASFETDNKGFSVMKKDIWVMKLDSESMEIPPLVVTEPSDITSPTLSTFSNRINSEGGDYTIQWFVEDQNPGTFELYLNSILIDSGSWTNGVITWSSTGLIPGTYEVTLVVWDSAENRSSDTIWVDVMFPSVTGIPTTPMPPRTTSPPPPSFFISGLTGFPILVALVALGMRRKRNH